MSALLASLANHPAAQQVREYIEVLQGRGRTAAAAFGGGGDDDRARMPTSSHDGDMDDADNNNNNAGASFVPPLDVFAQPDRWVVHLAVPGAKKEDIGCDWDAGRATLSIRGVVHRPGDEEFLRGQIRGERSVGLFERQVRLGGTEEAVAVDGEGISARMEEGLLVIVVPKVEKEWTEVKRVEIE